MSKPDSEKRIAFTSIGAVGLIGLGVAIFEGSILILNALGYEHSPANMIELSAGLVVTILSAVGYYVVSVANKALISVQEIQNDSKILPELRQVAARLVIDIGHVRETLGSKATVVRESPEQAMWRGFVGTYHAFNPSFGSDFEAGDISNPNRSRLQMHIDRYRPGSVTRANYYLYEGTANEGVEAGILQRFVALVKAVEKQNPEISNNETLRIWLLDGSRADTSVFLGEKREVSEGGLHKTALFYVNNDKFSILSDGLIPRLLFSTNDPLVTDPEERRLQDIRSKVKPLTLREFLAYFDKRFPPSSASSGSGVTDRISRFWKRLRKME